MTEHVRGVEREQEQEEATAATPPRRWRELAQLALLYLAARVVAVAAMGAGAKMVPAAQFGSTFHAWDGAWYLHVAQFGYPDHVPMVDGHAAQSGIAFFPVYPLLVRGFGTLPGLSPLRAAVLLSLAFGFVATLLVRQYAREVFDPDAGFWAAALFAFFPGSLAFTMAYSEAVVRTAATASLLLAHRRRWLAADLVAAVATATRANALALAPALAVVALLAVRDRRERRALSAPVLAPLGTLAYFLFLQWRTGSFSRGSTSRRAAGESGSTSA